jgi:hypothetical protein
MSFLAHSLIGSENPSSFIQIPAMILIAKLESIMDEPSNGSKVTKNFSFSLSLTKYGLSSELAAKRLHCLLMLQK